MRVAITGATGLIGWHVRCALHAQGINSVAVSRDAFANPETLRGAIGTVDAVVHAAGANRGDDADVAATNISLADTLRASLGQKADAPLTIFLNSTHVDRDSAYGRSKAAAAARLSEVPGGLLDLILPGVFGEQGRPYYNSVVSTFCHQLARGEVLTVLDDAELHLIHAQDVADIVIGAIVQRRSGSERPAGRPIGVVELAAKLQSLHQSYASGVIPDIADPFDRALFNTLRSYRFPSLCPTELEPRSDQRGRLVELVKANTGGQMFISTTVPGITRGNHYHRRKTERFAVVEGTATISLRRLFSEETVTFEVSGNAPVAVDMPTLHTHNITNVGQVPLVTLFWTDEIFDPEHPDTYGEPV